MVDYRGVDPLGRLALLSVSALEDGMTYVWLTIQLLVAFAVLSANIYWQITPNGVVAALGAFGAAYSVTWLLSWLSDRRKRRKAQLSDKGSSLTIR